VQGTDVDMPLIRSWATTDGVFFTQQDVNTASKVAVLGSVLRDQLFASEVEPVGQIIRISHQPFTPLRDLAARQVSLCLQLRVGAKGFRQASASGASSPA